ncbi:FAD-binding PCMH-type domain-containing protein [Physcia stellaris]|nr:FAD-binding PCMH-type domain-containing protein [Physcia stellaris]
MRGNLSVLESIDDGDFSSAENLDANRCASVYETTSSLQPAVASAISSATVAAQAALATRDPTKLQDLPECAQHCVLPGLAAGGCSGEADLLSFISKRLCGPVGGQEPKVESACGYPSNITSPSVNPVNATTTRPTSPSVNTLNSTSAPFTGSTVSTRLWAAGSLNAVVVVLLLGFLVT